jgi:antitoxin VapB
MSEFETKTGQVESLLDELQLDALVLNRVSSFGWATCGSRSYVNTAADAGIATLVLKRGERHLITNRIESPRLDKEEQLVKQGWTFHVADWFAADDTLAALTRGLRVGSDTPLDGAKDLSAEVSRMRSILQPVEQERFRALGAICADAMHAAIHRVRPGQTEYEIAAGLAFEAESRGAQAIVNLIATDERIFSYRHPLPTGKKLDHYAMLVLCGRRDGLVCSITRLVHFGSLPADLRRKATAVAQIDAAFIMGTRPGRTLGAVFAEAQSAYAAAGFPDEWQLHHQGGPAGYEPRELIATPGSDYRVAAGQTYAWNPSITGAKSEDTVLVLEGGNQVLTTIEGWPMIEVQVTGGSIHRPDILVL